MDQLGYVHSELCTAQSQMHASSHLGTLNDNWCGTSKWIHGSCLSIHDSLHRYQNLQRFYSTSILQYCVGTGLNGQHVRYWFTDRSWLKIQKKIHWPCPENMKYLGILYLRFVTRMLCTRYKFIHNWLIWGTFHTTRSLRFYLSLVGILSNHIGEKISLDLADHKYDFARSVASMIPELLITWGRFSGSS